jgi:predicted DNA-binding transcriptional regulator AlpA
VWVDELKNRDPGSFVFMSDVCEITGLPDTTIRNLIAAGEFPKPIRLDGRRMCFVIGEVFEWRERVAREKRSPSMRPDLQEVAIRAGRVRGDALRSTNAAPAAQK